MNATRTARFIRDADPSLSDAAIAFLTGAALADPYADPVAIPASLDTVFLAAFAGASLVGADAAKALLVATRTAVVF